MSQFGNGWSNPPGYAPAAAAPPAGAGEQWWAYCLPSAAVDNQPTAHRFADGTWDGAIYDGAGVGPFPTKAQAQAAAYAQCHGAAPPPAQQPPQQPPQQPQPPEADAWWNVCTSSGGSLGIVTVGPLTRQQALSGVPNSVGIAGPYGDSAKAQLNAPKDLGACASQASSSAQKCEIKSLVDCPAIPAALKGIGTPGTREWCTAIDAIVSALGNIGTHLFAFIDERLDANLVVKNIDDYYATLQPYDTIKPLLGLMRMIVCWIGPYIETLRQSITCLRQWTGTLFPKCNTTSLFGLLTIRHVLMTLEQIEWGSDAAAWIIAKSGFVVSPLMDTLDYLIRYACPIDLMSEGEVMECIRHFTLDDDIANCVLAAHGKQREQMEPVLRAASEKVGWREIIQYNRRNDLTAQQTDDALRLIGVYNPDFRMVMNNLYDELPTIGDHLEWLRKNVFDDDYVKDFKLMDGFDTKFWPAFGHDLRSLGMTEKNARYHYAAHWLNPSFSQQFDMVQRLRPGRVDPSLVFSRDDLLRTMQEMDVGVYFRERLESVSHPVPNLTLCLQMYQYGTVADAEFVEMLKDLGYDDANAGKILASQIIKVRRANASSGHGWTTTALASAFAVGQLTADQVRAEMSLQGYSADEQDRLMARARIELRLAPIRRIQQTIIRSALATQQGAYKCGATTADALLAVYRNAGIPDDIAKIAIADVDTGIEVSLCSEQISALKKALFAGKATLAQVGDTLAQAGVPPLRAKQYLDSWLVQLQLRSPTATAGQILRWVATGLLDRSVAAQRLSNLGWSDPDLTLLLAESVGKLSRLQEAIQRQSAKSQQSAAKAALSLARQAEATARQLRSRLRGIASIATLKKWLKDGLIDDATFIDYATARGYPPHEAELYLADAKQAASKPKKPPKAASPPGAQGNGTTQGQPGSPAP